MQTKTVSPKDGKAGCYETKQDSNSYRDSVLKTNKQKEDTFVKKVNVLIKIIFICYHVLTESTL